jgi:predicted nucleic acid-binding Zn ribbon protein
MAKKKAISKGQQRSMRTQQIVMGVIGVMIILAMVLSMVAKR